MPRTIKPPLPNRTLTFAKRLRKCETDAEKRLWYHLRAKRFQGMKWRRQHPLPPYVMDFYCHAAMLVIELDGGQHGARQDSTRTAFLESLGLQVLRFWDNQVLSETNAVLELIFTAMRARTLSPGPSPAGRGEQWSDM
jgi:very-short-patch-repair endonuclease